jgi:hypothetical protein
MTCERRSGFRRRAQLRRAPCLSLSRSTMLITPRCPVEALSVFCFYPSLRALSTMQMKMQTMLMVPLS